MDAALRALLVLVAGCSVPALSLDGKSCPCTAGYTCNTATQKCEALGTGDGGKRDGASGSCLGSAPGMMLSSGFSAFVQGAGAWTFGASAQSPNAPLAYAYANDASLDVGNYRIVAHVSSGASSGRIGIAIRVNTTPDKRYECVWDLGASSTLLWRSINNTAATTIPPTTTRATSLADITMEVLASGGTLTCCIDEVSASVMVTNATSPATGFPGAAADAIAATFDRFDVYAN